MLQTPAPDTPVCKVTLMSAFCPHRVELFRAFPKTPSPIPFLCSHAHFILPLPRRQWLGGTARKALSSSASRACLLKRRPYTRGLVCSLGSGCLLGKIALDKPPVFLPQACASHILSFTAHLLFSVPRVVPSSAPQNRVPGARPPAAWPGASGPPAP